MFPTVVESAGACCSVGHWTYPTFACLHSRYHFRKTRGGRIIDEADNDYLEWILKSFPNSKAKNNVHDLLANLKFCSRKKDILEGRRVHTNAVESGHGSNIFVAAALINMYAKCGSMRDAQQVFDRIQKPNVVSWTTLILGYVDNGEGDVALDFFSRMKTEHRCAPDPVTYLAAIKACTSLAVRGDGRGKRECLERGSALHVEIGGRLNHFVQNALINMYAKCGSMVRARLVFASINVPDVVSWNALILGYADNEQALAALDCFSRMKIPCDSLTYVAALKACTCLAADGAESGKGKCLQRGREIHLEIGHQMDHFLQNTLINMYAKCGSMVDAQRVFDGMEDPNQVSWNALILGYVNNGESRTALDFFSIMKTKRTCAPDSVTYLAAIKACTSLAMRGDDSTKREYLVRGRKIHLGIGCRLSQFVQNALINMYAKCGSMADAWRVFKSMDDPDVLSWNVLILGYADNGESEAALDFFSRMKHARDSLTYVAALKACTSLAICEDEAGKEQCLVQGREIHLEIGHRMDHFVQNTLINMYAKCGSMIDAQQVFDNMEEPDLVSWNALILGYADNAEGQAALDCFFRLRTAATCTPDSLTYVAVIKACGSIGALAIGRNIQSEIAHFDVHVVSCLVHFYSKCGNMVEAREVFDSHSRERDITTWTALITGYANFGDTVSVFNLFQAMQDQGLRPDAVTFVCILSCCSHAGLVEKAREYFDAMPVQYGVTPSMMHYNCMIDILGRANQLDEAVTLLRKMPCNPNSVSWMALLSACHKWKNIEIGRVAFQSLVDLDEKNTASYVLMAQIYGSRHMWEEQQRVLKAGSL